MVQPLTPEWRSLHAGGHRGFINCYQLHKPDSVILLSQHCYHLSTTVIAGCLHLPTLERSSLQNIQTGRLSAFLYMAFQHPRFTHDQPSNQPSGALTSRFHPYSNANGRSGNFLWHCLAPALLCIAAGCPAVSGMGCPILSGLSSPALRQQR